MDLSHRMRVSTIKRKKSGDKGIMDLGSPHNTSENIINQKERMAHHVATTFPNNNGTKTTPPHRCYVISYPERTALETITHTAALMPDNHPRKPQQMPNNNPQPHSYGAIDYMIHISRSIIVKENSHPQAHPCNLEEPNTSMHTHEQHSLPQKHINTPPLPEPDLAIRQTGGGPHLQHS